MALHIITDSASDLPKHIIEEYQLHVIPTPVIVDGTDYFDGETIYPKEFYQKQEEGAEISTYHINTFMFEEHFRPFAEAGDSVIYLCFSTGLAGTFNAARLAKENIQEDYPDFDLTIIDSRCASLGFGLLVYYALEQLKNGVDKETIIKSVEHNREHMKHVITVNTLEYLYKGGRLSRGSKVMGDLLDIHPILEMTAEGSLQAVEKVRGRRKSLARCVDMVGELGGKDFSKRIIGVCHGDDEATMKKVEAMLTEHYGCNQFIESYVGCAIGAHTGAGIIGIVFLDEEPK